MTSHPKILKLGSHALPSITGFYWFSYIHYSQIFTARIDAIICSPILTGTFPGEVGLRCGFHSAALPNHDVDDANVVYIILAGKSETNMVPKHASQVCKFPLCDWGFHLVRLAQRIAFHDCVTMRACQMVQNIRNHHQIIRTETPAWSIYTFHIFSSLIIR